MRTLSTGQRAFSYTSTFSRQTIVYTHPPQLQRLLYGLVKSSRLTDRRSGSCSLRTAHQKHFSHSCIPKAREQPRSQSPPTSQDPEFPVLFTPLRKVSSTKSQIRESLRAWSVQNERIKQEQTPDILPYEGRITRLPNALFLAPTQPELEEDPNHDEDQDEWDALEDDEFSIPYGGELLKPGALVWHRSGLIKPQNVVYMGSIGVQSLLLLSNGKWAADEMKVKRNNISTITNVPVPNFLTKEEIERFRAHMPQQDVTRAVEEGAPQVPINVVGPLPDDLFATVAPRFQNVKDAHERFMRDYKVQLDQMYDSLAHEDKWRKVGIKDLPSLALNIPWDDLDLLEQKAFVLHANSFHPLLIPTQSANTVTYFIGPKRVDEDMKLVQGWSRLYQDAAARAAVGQDVSVILRHNPLASFIDKARRIILKSRKIRVPTSMGVLGPVIDHGKTEAVEKVPTGETFTADDKKILYYLWDVAYRRPMSAYPFAHACLIVRAIGSYPDLVLDNRTVRMLLQELGCADPWTQPEDIELCIPGRQIDHGINELKRKADLSLTSGLEQTDLNTLLTDSMADLRKDWGDMEAICIDSKYSSNLEDAISIEPADELDQGYWIHVHISHPTAYLDRDHPIAQFARKQGTAWYNHHEGEPILTMIPEQLVKHCSLSKSHNVLTISTLVSQDGSVHDIDIKPGKIRRITRLSSDAVRDLQDKETKDEAILVVGRINRLSQATDAEPFHDFRYEEDLDLARKYLPTLNLLNRLLTARRDKRLEEMPMVAHAARISKVITTRLRVPEPYKVDRIFESYHWKGDPGIAFWGKRVLDTSLTPELANVTDILAGVMRLSSESVGKWFADRRIPTVFLANDVQTGHTTQKAPDGLSKQATPQLLFLRSAEPKPYHALNMRQFAGCTSPSRRFIDMMAHFQIDSYLRAEAEGRVRPGAPVEDESMLAFTTADVQEYLAADAASSDMLTVMGKTADKLWSYLALFRAFHFKEAVVPQNIEVMIDYPARRGADGRDHAVAGILVPWSFRVELEPSAEGFEKKANYQDFLPIQILRIEPNMFKIFGRATGPPTTQQQFKDPIKCYTSENFAKREHNQSNGELLRED